MEDEDGDDNDAEPSDSHKWPDPRPKWRAMFYIFLNHRRTAVLGDSGCTFSCISYDYYVNNPHLRRAFVPNKSRGVAINGSEVNSIGKV